MSTASAAPVAPAIPANRSVFLCEYGAYYLPDIEKLLDVRFSSILPTEEMLKLPEPVQGAKLPRREPDAARHSGHRGGSGRGARRTSSVKMKRARNQTARPETDKKKWSG